MARLGGSVWLFGGDDGGSRSLSSYSWGSFRGDLWRLGATDEATMVVGSSSAAAPEAADMKWKEISTAGSSAPSPRSLHSCTVVPVATAFPTSTARASGADDASASASAGGQDRIIVQESMVCIGGLLSSSSSTSASAESASASASSSSPLLQDTDEVWIMTPAVDIDIDGDGTGSSGIKAVWRQLKLPSSPLWQSMPPRHGHSAAFVSRVVIRDDTSHDSPASGLATHMHAAPGGGHLPSSSSSSTAGTSGPSPLRVEVEHSLFVHGGRSYDCDPEQLKRAGLTVAFTDDVDNDIDIDNKQQQQQGRKRDGVQADVLVMRRISSGFNSNGNSANSNRYECLYGDTWRLTWTTPRPGPLTTEEAQKWLGGSSSSMRPGILAGLWNEEAGTPDSERVVFTEAMPSVAEAASLEVIPKASAVWEKLSFVQHASTDASSSSSHHTVQGHEGHLSRGGRKGPPIKKLLGGVSDWLVQRAASARNRAIEAARKLGLPISTSGGSGGRSSVDGWSAEDNDAVALDVHPAPRVHSSMAVQDGGHGLLLFGGAHCAPGCRCIGDGWKLSVPPVAVVRGRPLHAMQLLPSPLPLPAPAVSAESDAVVVTPAGKKAVKKAKAPAAATAIDGAEADEQPEAPSPAAVVPKVVKAAIKKEPVSSSLFAKKKPVGVVSKAKASPVALPLPSPSSLPVEQPEPEPEEKAPEVEQEREDAVAVAEGAADGGVEEANIAEEEASDRLPSDVETIPTGYEGDLGEEPAKRDPASPVAQQEVEEQVEPPVAAVPAEKAAPASLRRGAAGSRPRALLETTTEATAAASRQTRHASHGTLVSDLHWIPIHGQGSEPGLSELSFDASLDPDTALEQEALRRQQAEANLQGLANLASSLRHVAEIEEDAADAVEAEEEAESELAQQEEEENEAEQGADEADEDDEEKAAALKEKRSERRAHERRKHKLLKKIAALHAEIGTSDPGIRCSVHNWLQAALAETPLSISARSKEERDKEAARFKRNARIRAGPYAAASDGDDEDGDGEADRKPRLGGSKLLRPGAGRAKAWIRSAARKLVKRIKADQQRRQEGELGGSNNSKEGDQGEDVIFGVDGPQGRYRHTLVSEYRRSYLATMVRASMVLQRLRYLSFSHGLTEEVESKILDQLIRVVEDEEEHGGPIAVNPADGSFTTPSNSHHHERVKKDALSSVSILFGGETYAPSGSVYFGDAWLWLNVEQEATDANAVAEAEQLAMEHRARLLLIEQQKERDALLPVVLGAIALAWVVVGMALFSYSPACRALCRAHCFCWGGSSARSGPKRSRVVTNDGSVW